LQLAYKVACELYDNITEGQTHYLKLNVPSIEADGSTNASALDDMFKQRQKVISYSPKEIVESYAANAEENKIGNTIMDK